MEDAVFVARVDGPESLGFVAVCFDIVCDALKVVFSYRALNVPRF